MTVSEPGVTREVVWSEGLAGSNKSDPDRGDNNNKLDVWAGPVSPVHLVSNNTAHFVSSLGFYRISLTIISDQIMGKKTRMKWRRLDILEVDQTSEPSTDQSLYSHSFLKVSCGWFSLN